MAGTPPGDDACGQRELTPHELERLHADLVAILRPRVPSSKDAEDIAQQAFAIFLEGDARVRVRDVPGFLCGIAKNLVSAFYCERSRAKAPKWQAVLHLFTGESAESVEKTFEKTFECELLLAHLERALANLPPRQQAVLRLRMFERRSRAETAEALGINIFSVDKDQQQALASLAWALRDWQSDPSSAPGPRRSRRRNRSQPEPEDAGAKCRDGTP